MKLPKTENVYVSTNSEFDIDESGDIDEYCPSGSMRLAKHKSFKPGQEVSRDLPESPFFDKKLSFRTMY